MSDHYQLAKAQEVEDPLARATFDVMLSGKSPLIRIPKGHAWMAKESVERAVNALMSQKGPLPGLADPQRWLDLQAACGHTAQLHVIDRYGERYRVIDVLPDAGGETGQLLLKHLGRRSRQGDMLVDIQEGYGKMLPFVAYKKQNPPMRARHPRSHKTAKRQDRLPRRPTKKLHLVFRYPLLPPAAKREIDKCVKDFERGFAAVGRLVSIDRYVENQKQIVEVVIQAAKEYEDPQVLATVGQYDYASISWGFGQAIRALAGLNIISWAYAEKVQIGRPG